MRRRVSTLILLEVMMGVGAFTLPDARIFSPQFWLWLTILLLATIFFANVFLGEEQWELFNSICNENFKKAPIFGICIIPFGISLICLLYTGMRVFILK